MARNVAELTIFYSSTSETTSEFEILKQSMGDINKLLEHKGVLLRLVSWREDAPSGIGSSPQNRIDESVGSYDIYLGVLGSRYGTPTGAANSGTEHEYNLAVDRYHKDTTSIRLMFYFKKTIDMEKVDREQLVKVLEFKERIGDMGFLHKSYDDVTDFQKIVQRELISIINREWNEEGGVLVSSSSGRYAGQRGL